MQSEIFAIPCDTNRYLVYAPLRRVAFVANGPAVDAIARIREGRDVDDGDAAVRVLVEQLGLLGEDRKNRPLRRYTGPFSPSCLTLLLTTHCNLRCSYCYASSGDTAPEAMKLPLAKQGIDFLVQCAVRDRREGIELAYHGGGEPTLNWHVLTRSLQYARDRAQDAGLAVSAAAATNGVLSNEQITWIVEHLDGGLSVSIDGPPKVHDQHRRTAKGHGSGVRVVRTLHRLDDAGYPYGLRVTVTEDQVDLLADSIEYLCRQFRPARIQVEPVYCQGRWREGPSVDGARFADAFRHARLRAAYHGQSIEFSPVRIDTLSNHFCSATLKGHEATVRALLSAPQSGLLCSASDDGTVRLWQLGESGEVTTLRTHEAPVCALALDGDSDRLASGSADGTIAVWSLSRRRRLLKLSGHKTGVRCLAFGPKATLISRESTGLIVVWSARTGKVKSTLRGPWQDVDDLLMTPGGNTLVTISNKIVELRAMPSARVHDILRGHYAEISALAISPDGRTLATGDRDGVVILWNLAEGEQLAQLFDADATGSKASGVAFKRKDEATGRWITYTQPCGAPIPPGAICVCNCVPGRPH